MSSADMPLRAKLFELEDNLNAQLSAIYGRMQIMEALLGYQVAWDTLLADFIAGNYSVFRAVQLVADAAGQPAIFVRVNTVHAHDGVQWIVDNVGTVFERRSLV